MEFTYHKLNRGTFLETLVNIKESLQISSFGQIEYRDNPEIDEYEIADISDSLVNRMSPEMLGVLRAVE